MIKTRVWICLLGGLLLASLALLLWPQERAQSAEIWSDGVLVRRVSLAQDQSFYRGQPIRKQHRYHPEWSHRRNPVRLPRRRLHPDRLAAGRAAHRLPASPAGGPVLRRRRSRRRDRLRWRNTGAIVLFSLTFYGDGGNIDPILPALVEDRYILQQKGRLIMSYIPMGLSGPADRGR